MEKDQLIVQHEETVTGGTREGLPDGASLALKPTVPSADFEAKSGIRERQDPQIKIFTNNTFCISYNTQLSFLSLR